MKINKMNLFHLGLLIIWACSRGALSLVDLGDNIRAYSQYLRMMQNRIDFFKVEEYVDIDQGHIRLDLLDFRQIETPVTYFRLFEDNKNQIEHENVIFLNRSEKMCRSDDLNQWPLRELSNFIRLVNGHWPSEKPLFVPMKGWRQRQLALGPSSLQRFVYLNANLFKLDSQSYNLYNMFDSNYFTTKVIDLNEENSDAETKEFIRIIVVLPSSDKTKTSSVIKGTLLSQIETRENILIVAILRARTSKQVKILSELRSEEFFHGKNASLLIQLEQVDMVFFDLIQEFRSGTSMKHLGQLSPRNEQAFELSPFSLPPGLGCAQLYFTGEPLFVNTRQFSGRFVAHTFEGEFYVAFDELSKHLRYDSIGEFKMIYSLGDHFITMISTSEQISTQNSDDEKLDWKHRDKNLCAQYKRNGVNVHDKRVFDAFSIGHALGFGPSIGLMFLGTLELEDETVCQMFEREVSFEEIPLLILMHAKPNLNVKNKYFLNFYFVSHSIAQQNGSNQDYKTLWLRRITLLSLDDSRSSHLESQLTFDQSSWSLDVGSGQDDETQVELHTAHVFDTIECSSQQKQTVVEFRLEQTKDSHWLWSSVPLTEADSLEVREHFMQQLDQFEQKLISELVQRIRMPRAEMNQLEVSMDEQTDELLVSFIRTEPLDFEYLTKQVGWLLQSESVTQAIHDGKIQQFGEIIKLKRSMSLQECAMSLAISLNESPEIVLLHCPNVGCGYIQNDKFELVDYLSLEERPLANAPTVESYPSMCNIHKLVRRTAEDQFSGFFTENSHLRAKLADNVISIQLSKTERPDQDEAISDSNQSEELNSLYFGRAINLVVRPNELHLHWDKQIWPQHCFTKPNLTNDIIEIVQIGFDKHHSLLQCRQACLQYPSCSSYSYSSKSRQCTLSNLSETLLGRPKSELFNLISYDKSCRMYVLNQGTRYKLRRISHSTDPSNFFKISPRRPIIVANLSTCASLCHKNEMVHVPNEDGERIQRCLHFSYIRLYSLCYLMDDMILDSVGKKDEDHFHYDELLFSSNNNIPPQLVQLADKSQLAQHLGTDKPERSDEEMFERDPSVMFSKRNGIRLELKTPANKKFAPLMEKPGAHYFRSCLLECAIVDEHCDAFDFYEVCETLEEGIYSCDSHCVLYYFRSPLAFDEKLLDQNSNKLASDKISQDKIIIDGLEFNELEKQIYQNRSSEYSVSMKGVKGHHYFLKNDQLYLKRLLYKETKQNKQVEDDDDVKLFDHIQQRSKLSPWPIILELFLGISIGFVIFFYVKQRTSQFGWSSIRQKIMRAHGFKAYPRPSTTSIGNLTELHDM